MIPTKYVQYFGIPDNTTEPFNPTKIYKYILRPNTRVGRPDIFEMHFNGITPFEFPNPHAPLEAPMKVSASFLQEFVAREPDKTLPMNLDKLARGPSPLDINFQGQCFISIELDLNHNNWWFDLNDLALTTNDYFGTQNVYMFFFDKDASSIALPQYDFGKHTGPEKCRTIIFGVRQRFGSPTDDSQKFNLHVLIDHGGGSVLPLIFDPDIKNDGGGFGGGSGGG